MRDKWFDFLDWLDKAKADPVKTHGAAAVAGFVIGVAVAYL